MFDETNHLNNKELPLLPRNKHTASPITKINLLIQFREITAAYCENHIKHLNSLHVQNAVLLFVAESGAYIHHYVLNI
jgi:hypothetical protein